MLSMSAVRMGLDSSLVNVTPPSSDTAMHCLCSVGCAAVYIRYSLPSFSMVEPEQQPQMTS